MFDAAAAGSRNDVVAVRAQPRQRELRRRDAFFRGDFFNALDDGDVALEIAVLETWILAAIVIRLECVGRFDLAAQKSAADRRVGNEADAELARRRQDVVLRIARPKRVLALKCRDRMNGVSASNRLRSEERGVRE